jgi:hypothetical protein
MRAEHNQICDQESENMRLGSPWERQARQAWQAPSLSPAPLFKPSLTEAVRSQ